MKKLIFLLIICIPLLTVSGELLEVDSDMKIILCIGTSITAGYPGYNIDEGTWDGQYMDNPSYGDLQSFYGTRLLERLNEVAPNQFKIVNRGWGGEDTNGRLSRFEETLIDVKPDYVIIEGGHNDAHRKIPIETVKQNIKSMVALCREYGAVPIIATITPYDRPYAVPNDPFFTETNTTPEYYIKEFIPQLLEWQREYARSENIGLVDFYNAIADPNQEVPEGYSARMKPEYIADDGYYIHMTVAGYQAMGDIIDLALFFKVDNVGGFVAKVNGEMRIVNKIYAKYNGEIREIEIVNN